MLGKFAPTHGGWRARVSPREISRAGAFVAVPGRPERYYSVSAALQCKIMIRNRDRRFRWDLGRPQARARVGLRRM